MELKETLALRHIVSCSEVITRWQRSFRKLLGEVTK
ncbi:hypothetical protein T11_8529 [Trichinella zimbabwensis]|uniref:Uncharacterized protein n=1 Tax=Trichinella zimbabwensis TaxID=268475 RepID=A0A0V1GET7_9BILA|nr:hypothetical protein T11_14188 [Trichinella zimbabwensis]KRY95064.1 hypothetical protein T11_2987 [Trichinella zimbabwensis]KRY96742.1 hypothetical protein T11_8529 [Trichinella zimbabwensis]